jgi:hypothetical protein
MNKYGAVVEWYRGPPATGPFCSPPCPETGHGLNCFCADCLPQKIFQITDKTGNGRSDPAVRQRSSYMYTNIGLPNEGANSRFSHIQKFINPLLLYQGIRYWLFKYWCKKALQAYIYTKHMCKTNMIGQGESQSKQKKIHRPLLMPSEINHLRQLIFTDQNDNMVKIMLNLLTPMLAVLNLF